jgi:WD40 repeat protein
MPNPARKNRSSYPALFAYLLAAGLLVSCALAADDPPLPAGVVATLKGHTEVVYAIAFSPDGKSVLTGSFDKTLKLWDSTTGKEVKTFGGPTGHQNLVLAVAFSPDGRILASGASDNTAKLWDSPVSLPVREFVHAEAVNGLALSADGTKLAGAGKDGSVKLWNPTDGKLLFNLTGHTGPVTSVSFSANGQMIASSGSDKTVRFWNPANGQAIATLGAHATSINAVLIHPNNVVACSAGDDGTVKFWQLPVPAPRALPPHADAVTVVTLNGDGSQVVTASADKTVRISNASNGQQIRQFTGPTAAVASVALSFNQATLAAGTADGKLFVWNAGDAKVLNQNPVHSGPVTGVTFNPQNTQILTVGGDGLLKIWAWPPVKKPNQAVDLPVKTWEAHAGGVSGGIAIHNSGAQALSGGADKTVKLWDLASGKVLRTFGPMTDPISAVTFNRDYTQVGAAAGQTVKVWNAADAKELLTLTHPAAVASLSFSVDKTKIATGAADNLVRVWDAATGKELQFFSHGGPVRSVVFQPNNTSVVAGSTDKTTAIHSLSIVRMVAASTAPIHGLALTPAGSHLLTASADKTVKLWNIGNGANERTFVGAEGAVHCVAVSKNGLLVAAGGADKAVRVYTFADAKQQGVFKATGVVKSLAFSPNNQTLAAACEDKSLITWNVLFQPGQPVPADFGKPGQAFAHGGAATDVIFTADSTSLYSSGLDKTIKSWKLASDAPIKSFQHNNLVDAVAFHPTGTQLATGSHDGTVRIWDVVKGQPIRQINAHTTPTPSPVYCVAWSPDGKQVVSGSLDRTLKLWDAAAGTLVREFKAYNEKSVPLPASGASLAALAAPPSKSTPLSVAAVLLTGKVKDVAQGHRDGVFCVAFSPDGKAIVSGSSDRTIKIWNVADGSVARECINPSLQAVAAAGAAPVPPQAHPGWVYQLRFTPDGKSLVSVGNAPRNQGYLAVWNFADGKMLHGEELPLGALYSVAVSPDGKLLALACGPRGRQFQEVDCYLLKMPELDKRQAAK